MGRTTRTIVACLVLAASCAAAQAGTIISSVTKAAGNATAVNLVGGGLQEGVEAFSDRVHQLVNIPTGLLGADLIQVSNDDKGGDPYQLDVTVGRLSALYIGLDDRQPQPKDWMDNPGLTGLPTKFFDTGATIDIDEGADGDVDQTFSLWATIAPAGTYSLMANATSGNNYIVFGANKIIPEPSSIALAGMGLFGLAGMIRRRNRR